MFGLQPKCCEDELINISSQHFYQIRLSASLHFTGEATEAEAEYWVGDKSSFGFFSKMVWKNPNELSDQPNDLLKVRIKIGQTGSRIHGLNLCPILPLLFSGNSCSCHVLSPLLELLGKYLLVEQFVCQGGKLLR